MKLSVTYYYINVQYLYEINMKQKPNIFICTVISCISYLLNGVTISHAAIRCDFLVNVCNSSNLHITLNGRKTFTHNPVMSNATKENRINQTSVNKNVTGNVLVISSINNGSNSENDSLLSNPCATTAKSISVNTFRNYVLPNIRKNISITTEYHYSATRNPDTTKGEISSFNPMQNNDYNDYIILHPYKINESGLNMNVFRIPPSNPLRKKGNFHENNLSKNQQSTVVRYKSELAAPVVGHNGRLAL